MKKTSNENVIAEDGDVTRDSFVIILPPRHFGEVGGRFLGSTQFHVALVLKRHRVILREADENQRHAVSLSLSRGGETQCLIISYELSFLLSQILASVPPW